MNHPSQSAHPSQTNEREQARAHADALHDDAESLHTASTPLQSQTSWSRRRLGVLIVFAVLGVSLVVRVLYLQVYDHEFYQGQGDARHQRTVAISAHRGNLLDRSGKPLAISTPVQTIAGVPADLVTQPDALVSVANTLELDSDKLLRDVQWASDQGREFIHIKRQAEPALVDRVMELNIGGIFLRREFRRFYPSGRAGSHVLGFTDIDDIGSEGLELAYDQWLSGKPGKRRVVRDRTGREIAGRDVLEAAVPGQDLELSVDKQLQYFADRALIDAVQKNQAQSASLVVMNVRTGDVLAMANYPSYNPNDRADRSGGAQRNRAVTDVFEPGSTMKPFTILAALESGQFTADDIVYTSPGYYNIGKYEVSDIKDYGWLDLRGIVRKSSNVGVSKVATQLDPDQMWSVFDAFGFGRPPGSEFPGEVSGYFNHPTLWHRVEQASVSYGYGMSVSALQLVRAYSALANDGVMPPISFLATRDAVQGIRVIDADVTHEVREMLESVVSEGTGHRARVPGYRVAGKTGTSKLSQSGGYAEDRYVSVFAGFAPASQPELAAVVVVHDPKAGDYYGSVVAAPVFADVMSHALRLQGVEPDDIDHLRAQTSQSARMLNAKPLTDVQQSAGDRS